MCFEYFSLHNYPSLVISFYPMQYLISKHPIMIWNILADELKNENKKLIKTCMCIMRFNSLSYKTYLKNSIYSFVEVDCGKGDRKMTKIAIFTALGACVLRAVIDSSSNYKLVVEVKMHIVCDHFQIVWMKPSRYLKVNPKRLIPRSRRSVTVHRIATTRVLHKRNFY